jgi:uncharacterized protein YcfJ
MKKYILISVVLFASACASYRPILDENSHYNQVGEQQAEADIDQCLAAADKYLDKHKSERMGKEAGRGAATGAIIGGVLGVLGGGTLKSAAIGTGVGAVAGGAVGAGKVAAEDKLTPDQIKQRYVSNCLARKDYQVIGWK